MVSEGEVTVEGSFPQPIQNITEKTKAVDKTTAINRDEPNAALSIIHPPLMNWL
jgi:hypothetical protein